MEQSITKSQAMDLIEPLELKNITEILVKHYDFHEGLYDLSFEFQIAVGAVGQDPSSVVPGAIFGIKRIGITKAVQPGLSTVDAAIVNPVTVAKKVVSKKPVSK